MSRLAAAADAAVCDTLTQLGNGLINVGVWSLAMKQGQVAFVSMTAGMASNLAYNYLCPEQELPPQDNQPPQKGCEELSQGVGYVWETNETTGEVIRADYLGLVAGLKLTIEESGNTDTGWYQTGSFLIKRAVGDEWTDSGFNWEISNTLPFSYELIPEGDGVCGKEVDFGPQPPPTIETYNYTDESTGCELNVDFQGFIQRYEDGPAEPVFLIQSPEPTRARGGRIGACFFQPTIVYNIGGGGDGGQPPITIPVPDGGPPPPGPDGVPWWVPALAGALGGAIVNQILNALIPPGDAPVWPDTNYAIQGICETVGEGDIQPILSTPVKGGAFAPTVINRLDALTILLQYHLSLKTPICTPSKPALEGQWVTTQWESDEKMVDSGRRLRKLFRYRTKSARDLGQLSAYWEAFTWTSGPVVVSHKGAWWGTPQIWASTEEEGRRVLRFAAAEAGLDPDKTGEWGVSSSRAPRYGMPGTMRIKRFEGYPWVAKRDGSAWPNMLAKQRDP